MSAHDYAPAIAAAEAGVAAQAPIVAADPNRPVYHFRPPAFWMNDPNGTIYHNGYYHVFYQFNPYGDSSHDIHWGHTRSVDLVHWEQLPIAIPPSYDLDESGIWSGCTAINGDGRPIAFYTSGGAKGSRPFQQRAAMGDEDLIAWQPHPQNPILALGEKGIPHFEPSWRDPFIFHSAGRTFLVLGAADHPDEGENANVVLFEAEDDTLANWRYHGPIYSRPRSEMRFCECPNFFPLGDKFVLLLSPYAPVEYTVGVFDPERLTFTPESAGVLDPGAGSMDLRGQALPEPSDPRFYATNILYDPEGNCVLFGWVRGFKANQGWSGCLALPRLLSLGPDGLPRQRPVPALEQLRADLLADTSLRLDAARQALPAQGDALEIHACITLHGAARAGLLLRANDDGSRGIAIDYDGQNLRVGETTVALPAGPAVDLQIFLDKSVLEVFVNDGEQAVTQVLYPPQGDQRIWLIADGDAASFDTVRVWQMSSIW